MAVLIIDLFISFLQHAAAILPEPLGVYTNATLRQEIVSA